jgi:hypothetical protein
VNNYQAGTVDSRVDRNEQGIKPETYQGYRKKVFWKMTEDLEWIRDPRSSVENAINSNPKISPLYAFPTTLGPALEGLSPLPFRTRPRV